MKEGLFYSEKDLLNLCSACSKGFLLKRFQIPAGMLEDLEHPVARGCIFKLMRAVLENACKNSIFLLEYYQDKSVLVMEATDDMNEITLKFPYEEYDKYISVIKELNDLVSFDGCICLFVNNVPYALESGVYISTYRNYEKIIEISKKYSMRQDFSKGLDEIFCGIGERQYNICTLLPEVSLEELTETIKTMFFLNPKSGYERQGYGFTKYSKKKFFVSYCHFDQEQVRKVVDDLRSYALDFWIDEEQIDVGDRIWDRIEEGMREADLPIIFLSRHTKESTGASHELSVFFSDIIREKGGRKNWLIVKLDDVNPDDIKKGLGDFKYFDLEKEPVKALAESIKKKLNLE